MDSEIDYTEEDGADPSAGAQAEGEATDAEGGVKEGHAPAEEESDEEDEYLQDDIVVVCNQPDDMYGEEEDEEVFAEPELGEGLDDSCADSCATPCAPAHYTPASMQPGATPVSRQTSSRHKEWVNPKLQQAIDAAAGTPQAPGTAASASSRVDASQAPASKLSAAQRAKLGPLAHVPGGPEMDLSTASSISNIDLDSLPGTLSSTLALLGVAPLGRAQPRSAMWPESRCGSQLRALRVWRWRPPDAPGTS